MAYKAIGLAARIGANGSVRVTAKIIDGRGTEVKRETVTGTDLDDCKAKLVQVMTTLANANNELALVQAVVGVELASV